MGQEVFIVTGCLGRIGKKIVERLSKRGKVVGLDLKPNGCLAVDLAKEKSVLAALEQIRSSHGDKIASVIHLAAYYSFQEKDSPLYDAITVKGTKALLKGLQSFHVEQFLFTSTMLVHAPGALGETISEESSVEARWSYPRSKVAAEKAIRAGRGPIPSVILRIAGVYDDECHSIPISHQIERIYEKKLESHFFAGELRHGAAFIHMDDLIDAMELAVEKRKELPQETVLLIGENKTLSYGELQKGISQLLFGKPIKTFSLPKWFAKIGASLQQLLPFGKKPFIQPWMIALADDHYALDIRKAEKLLGWTPKRSLEKTLPKMIADLKKDPEAWYKKNGLV